MTTIRPVFTIGGFLALVLALIAFLTVDWRFWYRWNTLPEDPGEWPASYYQPTVDVPGDPQPFFPIADTADRTISQDALEAAAAYAEAHNSAALLVLHKGVIQHEQYWQDIAADSLFTGRAMTRSLIPPLIAIAMEEGVINSVDDRVGDYLDEWRDDPRGDITLRQLMNNASGLENPPLSGDPDPDNKSTRMALGGDFRAYALDFDLENTPGEFMAFSNANSQLLGAVLESATGEAYEDYLNSRLWAPLGASRGVMYVDDHGGMPAVYCCYRATPRDWLRYGAALLNDGLVNGKQIWPAGWVKTMTTPSDIYDLYAMQIWTGNPPPDGRRYYQQDKEFSAPHGEGVNSDNFFYLEGGGFRTMYVFPDDDLVILRLGYFDADWRTSAIPNLVLPGIRAGS